LVVSASGGLLSEVWSFKNHGLFQNFGGDCVWGQLNVKTPLFNLWRFGNHLVKGLDGLDTVVGLLEETLAHVGYSLFVFSDLLGDAHQHA
jgi:hypothetical protein